MCRVEELEVGLVSVSEGGMWLDYQTAKQAIDVKHNHFLVAYTQEDATRYMASRVISSLNVVEDSIVGYSGNRPPLQLSQVHIGYSVWHTQL